MKLSTTVTSASLWSFANSIGTRGLSFTFFVLLSRELDPKALGLMALALSAGFIVDTLCEAGLGDALVKQPSISPAFLRAVTTVQAGTGLFLLLLSAVIGYPVALLFQEPMLVYLLSAVLLASFFNAISLCPLALLRREMKFREIAIRNFIGTAIGGALGYVLARRGFGVWSLVGLHVANAFTGAVISCISARYLPLPSRNLQPIAAVFGFAWRMTGTRLLENSLSRADQFIVGSVFGMTALGLYALAGKLCDTLFSVVCAPFADVFLSKLARYADEREELRRQFLGLIHFAALVGPFAFGFSALFLTSFLSDLFGKQWNDAAPYIWIVLGFGAIQSIAYVNSVALVALGLARVRLNMAILSSTMWAVSIALLFRYGPLMAAVAWACRVSVVFPVQIAYLSRELRFGWLDYWKAAQAGLTVVLVTFVAFWGMTQLAGSLSHALLMRGAVLGLCALCALFVSLSCSPFVRRKVDLFVGALTGKKT